MKNIIFKTLTGSVTSAARSLLSSEIKKGAKKFFGPKPKTQQEIEQEIIKNLGYLTQYYSVDKNDNIVYKSSAQFIYEWITCNPEIKDLFIRDEENGQVFFEHSLITAQNKLELLQQFTKATKINSPALPGHLENALKSLPVIDYTSSLFKSNFDGWDKNNSSVIDSWLKNIYGNGLKTDEKLATLLFKKWIVGTANRAINPGAPLDGCLVLQGPNGAGKTQFFRQLLPPPFDKRTGEIYCNIKQPQKFVEAIVGKTIACFDEMSVLEHAKTEETFKQLLSSQFIDVRLVWRKDPQRYLLRQGFCGTSNPQQFIKDQFLSRRLWTIALNESERIDFDFLNQNKYSLWQEAVYLASQNFPYLLNMEEQKMVEEHNKQFLIS